MPAWVEEFKFKGDHVTMQDILEGRAPRPRFWTCLLVAAAIPLEGLRLGCEAYALDLNPVAHIIELCTLVYPQRYGKPDPTVRGMTGPVNSAGETTWGGLSEEVKYWGNLVLKKARNQISDLYPPIPDPNTSPKDMVPDTQASFFAEKGQKSLRAPGGYLSPVAYLWTRTVRCKNPSCGATVPLAKQTWLCTKKDNYVALKMAASRGEKEIRFEVVKATTEKDLGFDPSVGSKGGNANCPFCGTVADVTYVKDEGWNGRMSRQMMTIVCTRSGSRGKVYLSAHEVRNFIPDDASIQRRIDQLRHRSGLTQPNAPIANLPLDSRANSLGITVRPYGIRTWSDLFTPRQMLSLLTFANSIREAEEEMHAKGLDKARTGAIATLLACVLDKQADFNSQLCRLKSGGGRGIVNSFSRQAIAMVWDFAEANPFNENIACWNGCLHEVAENIKALGIGLSAFVERGSATELPWSPETFDAIITDPPYYDNVPYSDISDYFYMWLKRSVGHLYPEHFATESTPKKKEAIADPGRHGGDKRKAKRAYEQMMTQSFSEANRVLKPGGQMAVVYAHKTTVGWSTLVDALRESGFIVTEAWPMDTETAGRLRAQESAALASSIFLVARKREEDAGVGQYEDNVQPELVRIVRERVDTLWDMGVTGADLVIAAVGAGLRAFTRYEKVEYANGEEVPAEKFLTEVEGVVLDTMMGKLFGITGGNVSAVDPDSRFYVLWRFVYKTAEIDAGEAIVFTYSQHVELDGPKGLSVGKDALVEKKKAKYRIRDFTERGPHEKLGVPTNDGQPAPLIDVLHRILWLIENSPRELTEFLDEARPDRERLRVVAQTLAGAALSGKSEQEAERLVSTTPAEQAALGKLLANWRNLIESQLAGMEEGLFGWRK